LSRTDALRGALEAIERILNRGGDADDVLRGVVAGLHERGGYPGAAIWFVEENELVEGPRAGAGETAEAFPVAFEGVRVADLRVAGLLGPEDRDFLARVALIVSPYCLVGWDTGGVPWSDVT
jgi:hypothetical protein